jgi:ABC-type multidrug transport system ATPase subunit
MENNIGSAIIKVKNLTLRRQGRVLIDNLNVSFPANGLVALLGANGAGKSTLLRVLAGVSKATEGSLYRANELTIGWMPEPARFYRQLSVEEQLLLQADLLALPDPEQAVHKVLTEWRLEIVKNQRTEHLSLGYRQRLSLAQALLAPVDVLLLDEPMNGMDPDLMQQFKRFIADFKQHKLVIMATHLMAEVSELTDRVMVMHQGQLLAQLNDHQKTLSAVDLMRFYQDSLVAWQKAANHG